MSKMRDSDRSAGRRGTARQACLKKNRYVDARASAPPNGGRREEKGGCGVQGIRQPRAGKKKFRPDEKSECRRRVESEDGSGEYATTVGGESVFCTCKGFRVSTGRERRHMRLIRMISGLLGFAAAREAVIDEITGARCPSCKKASHREYCRRPTTRKGDTQRYLCNACGRKFSEGPEFGPTWYIPEMIMQSPSHLRAAPHAAPAARAALGRFLQLGRTVQPLRACAAHSSQRIVVHFDRTPIRVLFRHGAALREGM